MVSNPEKTVFSLHDDVERLDSSSKRVFGWHLESKKTFQILSLEVWATAFSGSSCVSVFEEHGSSCLHVVMNKSSYH